ncbi:MAG: hypothetical protein D6B26_01425, partial [Spirochaetaceae bacterium]
MEITAHLEVNFEQQKLIDLHSVMNILNLLALEFSMSDRVLGGFSPAKEAASEIYRMGACLRNDECILAESEAKVHEFVGKLREAAGLVLDIARHRY